MGLQIKQRYTTYITKHLPWVPGRLVLPLSGIVVILPALTALAFSYGPMVSVQPEVGSLSGGATPVADANASGGQSLKFSGAVGFQANCIAMPSACGYPDATNTGVPAGETLTNSGTVQITQDNAVVQNIQITDGQIIVKANNVTIKNTRIDGCTYYPIEYDSTLYSGLVIEDTEIASNCPQTTAGMSFAGYTARRMNVHGTADGFKANSNVLIEDSYIHSLYATADSHNDGVQSTGGSGVTIRHNTFKLGTGNSEIFQLGNEGGSNSNWTVDNNLIDGGGWVFSTSSSIPNMIISNNRFTRSQGYGIAQVGGATYSSNYYDDDGSPAANY